MFQHTSMDVLGDTDVISCNILYRVKMKDRDTYNNNQPGRNWRRLLAPKTNINTALFSIKHNQAGTKICSLLQLLNGSH